MQAFVLKKEIYLSTGTYSRYYPQTKSIAEAQTDQIFIDVRDALIYSPTAGPKPPDLRTSAH